jgi:hypothetical protein
MNTSSTIDMQSHMRDQFAQVGAYHEQKSLEQAVISGAVGGGGPFNNQGSYGNQAGFWIAISTYMKSMSVFFIPVLLLLSIAAYLAGWSPVVVFVSLFGALFFSFYALQYAFSSGRLWIASYKPFVYSLVSALILASIVTFVLMA